jgi:hypothetical protein
VSVAAILRSRLIMKIMRSRYRSFGYARNITRFIIENALTNPSSPHHVHCY